MTFVAAAFCPHPPLLVPDVSGHEPVAVRAPAVEAVRWLTEQPNEQLLVIGSGDRAAVYGPGSVGGFAGYGVDCPVRLPGSTDGASDDGGPLPLPLAVAAWLLAQAGWSGATTAATCAPSSALPAFPDAGDVATGLLVMGDGSARRSEKAPGWLDDRSAGYDRSVGEALAAGDARALSSELALGVELLAAGAPAWNAASRLLAGQRWDARLSYDDAPYGVGYLVATWSLASAP